MGSLSGFPLYLPPWFLCFAGCGSSSPVALPRPQKHQNPERQDTASIPAALGLCLILKNSCLNQNYYKKSKQ
jgi:hypothetical protein